MERSADTGIRFLRPPQLRRRGLLCPGMMSITDIALDLGFREASTFSTTFGKLAGRTPTDYRCSLPQGKA
jgi:AraC-like DNA-binding protein